ncbi:Hpt domain-containing protein [Pseudodesulfovibrio senegalensis]|uniref:Hpt domain-containing protein n=2 Tax=Pseudodesulfovibrio senegalensis TaxID=1721087 RepID=A0A6N6N4M2_9BACT|nr:Hpt domain-containing protein [Pseudodesulfovibrio senegalensis]
MRIILPKLVCGCYAMTNGEKKMVEDLFDSGSFMQSLGGDAGLASELLEAYLEDSLVRAEELGRALDEGDAPAAAKAAHSLKGMSGVVRASRLVSMALEMEVASRDARLDQVRAMRPNLDETLHETLGLMLAFLQTLKQ